MLFYQSEEAGHYLRLFAPLIVILYADALVDGMCKSLGQQTANVRNNTITSCSMSRYCICFCRAGVSAATFFTFVLTHALNFYLSLRLLLDASGSALPLGPLAKRRSARWRPQPPACFCRSVGRGSFRFFGRVVCFWRRICRSSI